MLINRSKFISFPSFFLDLTSWKFNENLTNKNIAHKQVQIYFIFFFFQRQIITNLSKLNLGYINICFFYLLFFGQLKTIGKQTWLLMLD